MKKIIVVALAFSLIACVSGAINTEVSPGVHELNISGSIMASQKKYEAKLNKKAEQVCPTGYEVIKPVSYSSSTNKSYVNGQMMDIPVSHFSMTVKCK